MCKFDWSSHYVMIRFAKVKVCLRGLEVIARFNQLVINYLTIHHSSCTISQALISIYLSHANNTYTYTWLSYVKMYTVNRFPKRRFICYSLRHRKIKLNIVNLTCLFIHINIYIYISQIKSDVYIYIQIFHTIIHISQIN